jgi:hypothetical protein
LMVIDIFVKLCYTYHPRASPRRGHFIVAAP